MWKSFLADKLIGIFTWNIPHRPISHMNTVISALVIVWLTSFPHGGNICGQLMTWVPHKQAFMFHVSEPDEILWWVDPFCDLWSEVFINKIFKQCMQFVISPHSILPHSKTRPNEHHMISHIWLLPPQSAVSPSHVVQDCSLLCLSGDLKWQYVCSPCWYLTFEEGLKTVFNYLCSKLSCCFSHSLVLCTSSKILGHCTLIWIWKQSNRNIIS